jgi:hypothetical protein
MPNAITTATFRALALITSVTGAAGASANDLKQYYELALTRDTEHRSPAAGARGTPAAGFGQRSGDA